MESDIRKVHYETTEVKHVWAVETVFARLTLECTAAWKLPFDHVTQLSIELTNYRHRKAEITLNIAVKYFELHVFSLLVQKYARGALQTKTHNVRAPEKWR